MKPQNPSDLTNFVNGYIASGIFDETSEILDIDEWVQYSDNVDINIFTNDGEADTNVICATAYPLFINKEGYYQTDCSGNFYTIEGINQSQFKRKIKC
tara:strand:- start:258 stop:551 length:294 start_codon:yes stop_codon:yes gene_type:complete